MRWTIAKKAGLLIIGVMSATLATTFIILMSSTSKQTNTTTQLFLDDIEQSLIHSLKFAMGQGITDVTPFVTKMKQIKNLRELEVLPRNSIRSNSEEQMDAVERTVLSTRQPQAFREIYQNEAVMRSVQPILADSTCVSCHGGSIGEPLAIVTVRYSIEATEARQKAIATYTIVLALISIVLTSFFIIFLLQRQVSKPLANLITQSEAIADGDLTATINYDAKDEIGALAQVFRRMTGSLESSIAQIVEATTAVASATTEISAGTEQMAAGAQEQSTQASEISSAVEEITKTIADNSRNASATADTAVSAKEAAIKGGKVVEASVAGMKQIAAVVSQVAETVKALGTSSSQIGDITAVIDDIADQTNLLALNAAIEAARAGEQGRGFAVVADEVRKLAERTTQATKEIGNKIKRIQGDTSIAITAMQEGSQEVDDKIRQADAAGTALGEIVAFSNKVTQMISVIATASDQQAKTSEEISRSVEGISNVTHETATGLQQIARSSEDLNRLTEKLQSLTELFVLSKDNHPAEQSEHRVNEKDVHGNLIRRPKFGKTTKEASHSESSMKNQPA